MSSSPDNAPKNGINNSKVDALCILHRLPIYTHTTCSLNQVDQKSYKSYFTVHQNKLLICFLNLAQKNLQD